MISMVTVMVGKEKVKAAVIGVRVRVGTRVKERHIVRLLVKVENLILARTVKIMERATTEKGKVNIPTVGKASHLMDEVRAKAPVKTTLRKKTRTLM